MNPRLQQRAPAGFTLVITLLILVSVTILVVGLFSMATTEKQISASFDAVEQAELAIDAGFAKATAQLMGVTERDDFVLCSKSTGTDAQGRSRDYLVAAKYDSSINQWRYTPLVSGVDTTGKPPFAPTTTLKIPDATQKFVPANKSDGSPCDPAVSYRSNLFDPKNPGTVRSTFPKLLPWKVPGDPANPDVYWEELRFSDPTSTTGVLTARYCYEVEDLQAGVNLQTAGNSDGDGTHANSGQHMRGWFPTLSSSTDVGTAYPLPVPGLNLKPASSAPLGDQGALFTLLFPNDTDDTKSWDNAIFGTAGTSRRHLQFTPDMWKETLLAAGASSDWLKRDADPKSATYGRLPLPAAGGANPNLRAVEESSVAGLQPYKELALIPPYPGFVINSTTGILKLNLNKFLKDVESAAPASRDAVAKGDVTTIANFIHSHLPNFEKRAGGLPVGQTIDKVNANLNYLKTLAAGMIDYADTDSLPILEEGQYRGMDSFPIVNEHWERLRWENVITQGTSKYFIFSVTTYFELWNCTNKPVKGQVKASFAYNPVVTGKNSYQLQSVLNNPSNTAKVVPNAQNIQPAKDSDGTWWTGPVAVCDPDDATGNSPLPPNGYQVVMLPPAWFQFTVNAADFVQYLDVAEDSTAPYRLKFQPDGASSFALVDRCKGTVDCYERKIYYPGDSSNPQQLFNSNLPGEAFSIDNLHFYDNISDSRISFYLGGSTPAENVWEQVNYGHGSSPGVRNLRYSSGENYKGDQIYGTQNIAQWPDGGHNTFIPDTNATSTRPYRVKTTNDGNNINPDDTTIQARAKAARDADPDRRNKFVQRISNSGKFYSATELGNIYDPVMWDPAYPTSSTNDKNTWATFKDIGKLARASTNYGGGNSLRMGRAEHSLFRPDYSSSPASWRPADRRYCATALLDLFHCGILTSANCAPVADVNGQNSTGGSTFDGDLIGDFVKVDGQVNLNTASRDSLRALVAGKLTTDPLTSAVAPPTTTTSASPATAATIYPPHVTNAAADGGFSNVQANYIADLIIQKRPFISPAELPEKLTDTSNIPVLGNNASSKDGTILSGIYTNSNAAGASQFEWNAAAASETFARLYNQGTVRSRNFRIYVTGQAVRTTRSGLVEVLATRSRVYHVFINPQEYEQSNGVYTGKITRQQVQITYERSL